MAGLDTGGRPVLATQEMLQSLTADSDLPTNFLAEMDSNANFYVESQPDSPNQSFANTAGAHRFRQMMEANYPGISNIMKNFPGSRDMQGTPEGRRRLMMAGMALWLRQHGQEPVILSNNEGMMELLDSQGFETWDKDEVESHLKKDMNLQAPSEQPSDPNKPSDKNKPNFDGKKFGELIESRSKVDGQVRKTQQLRKDQMQKYQEAQKKLSEKTPKIQSESQPESPMDKPKRSISMDGP